MPLEAFVVYVVYTEGEHIGLIGANGEGKATFMNIVTGQ